MGVVWDIVIPLLKIGTALFIIIMHLTRSAWEPNKIYFPAIAMWGIKSNSSLIGLNVTWMLTTKFYKTCVINDPLGQPTFPSGSDCRWILKFCAGRTYRRTDGQTDVRTDWRTTCVKIVITTGRDCGRPRGSTRHVSSMIHSASPRVPPASREHTVISNINLL